jgi:hypothetical protein
MGSVEKTVSHLNNASNKQYALVPVGRGGWRGGGSRGDQRGRGAQGGVEDLVEVLH